MKSLTRKIVFVGGKGGVGKTTLSRAFAAALRAENSSRRVLWVCFEDPIRPRTLVRAATPEGFDELNCCAAESFAEYIALKLPGPLAKLFLGNPVIKYLGEAAPGIRELVMLGKIWFEREHYDHIICDMPSTGYGLALFQSTFNFSQLFGAGPVSKDALAMIETFCDPQVCAHVIVSLAEEMPLVESLELRKLLIDRFPEQDPEMIVNRLWPTLSDSNSAPSDSSSEQPLLTTRANEFVRSRNLLESENLKAWSHLTYQTLPYVDPSGEISKTLARLWVKTA
jgi:hypothetical protein